MRELLVGAVGIVLLAGCGEASTGGLSMDAKGWQYMESEQKIDGKTSIFACVNSEPDASGKARAQLCLLHTPAGYVNYVTAPGEGFHCDKCQVNVAFDDKPAELMPAFRHDAGDGEAIVFGEQEGLGPKVTRIRVAISKKTILELPMADGKLTAFSFPTEGIDRDKMTLDGVFDLKRNS